MECVMDYPTAWEFVRKTKFEHHDQRCSYVQMDGGMLCDCYVLNDEYARRGACPPSKGVYK